LDSSSRFYPRHRQTVAVWEHNTYGLNERSEFRQTNVALTVLLHLSAGGPYQLSGAIVDKLSRRRISKTGAELLFEFISQRYERGSIIITSNLPFDEWTEVFGSERLTSAILDRLSAVIRR
jgi:hypothetical protein